jgi:hypothetical protein
MYRELRNTESSCKVGYRSEPAKGFCVLFLFRIDKESTDSMIKLSSAIRSRTHSRTGLDSYSATIMPPGSHCPYGRVVCQQLRSLRESKEPYSDGCKQQSFPFAQPYLSSLPAD